MHFFGSLHLLELLPLKNELIVAKYRLGKFFKSYLKFVIHTQDINSSLITSRPLALRVQFFSSFFAIHILSNTISLGNSARLAL